MTRNVALDALKVLLAFCVVGLHAKLFIQIQPKLSWLTVNGLFRIAVPCFFVINGYFLRDSVLRGKALDWVRRNFVLYALWFVLYEIFWMVVLRQPAPGLVTVILGPYHLWYLIGVVVGVLVLLVLKDRTGLLIAAALAAFAVGVALQYLRFFPPASGPIDVLRYPGVYRNGLLLGFPLLTLGYLIRSHDLDRRVSMPVALALLCVGLVMVLVESWILGAAAGMEGSADNFIFTPVACAGLFLVAQKTSHEGTRGADLSMLATAIYLSHVGILDIVAHFTGFGTIATAVTLVLTIPVSLVLIQIQRRFGLVLNGQPRKRRLPAAN